MIRIPYATASARTGRIARSICPAPPRPAQRCAACRHLRPPPAGSSPTGSTGLDDGSGAGGLVPLASPFLLRPLLTPQRISLSCQRPSDRDRALVMPLDPPLPPLPFPAAPFCGRCAVAVLGSGVPVRAGWPDDRNRRPHFPAGVH
eukprot:scaffold2156_cov430-Prasinococcus_capsulatus_cf.AAC.7